MRKQHYLIMVLLTILNLNLNLNAQVAVNTTGQTADGSAMLDVSSTEKGILIPRLNLSQRNAISNPVTGLMIFQTDNTPGFYFYNGTAWVVVGDGATSINSLHDGITDSYSLFLGEGSGTADDGTDNRNTAVGINAYNASVSGYANTAFGNEALKLNTTGTHNAVFGTQALTSNLTGIENTVIGTNAGFNVTGSGNILIGSNAAFSETNISNKLYIDNSSTGTPLLFGDFSTNLFRVNGTLDINNAYQLPTTDGTSGQTLKTDGSGSLTWSSDVGATSLNDLSDASTDNNSLFLGIDAGANDDGTTNFNTGTGVWSLKDVTSGSHNAAFGTTALQNLTTGSQNTAVGTGSLNSATTGSKNTAIGKEAGKNVTGDGNIFIGNEAAKSQTAISNKLFIDNSDTIAPLIYGDFETNTVRINHKLELTSDSTGSSLKLFEPDTAGIHYTMFKTRHQDTNIIYKLPMENGSSGNVLKINGIDELYWGNDNGALNINGLSDGKTFDSNVFLGIEAGKVATANYNTGVGYRALTATTYGSENTALGDYTLKDNTTGDYNTAFGSFSAGYNTIGNGNVALGCFANNENRTGSNNIIIGFKAGGVEYSSTINRSGCVFIGYSAGQGHTGDNKLIIENSNSGSPLIYGEFDNDLVRINGDLEVTGSLAGMDIDDLSDAKTDGSNVFLGNNSGINDDGDNENTALGIDALKATTSGTKNTAIGYHALIYGGSGSNNTAVGSDAGQTFGSDLSNTGAFGQYTIVLADNYFRIGNTSVSSIGGQVGWSTYSDGRFKRNIQQNVPGLDFILKLKPVSYNWDIKKLDAFIGATELIESNEQMISARRQQEAKTYTGFLAQEVEKAAKEIGYDFSGVETPPNDGTPYSIRYAEFVVPLVKAVQEQQEMIEVLQKQNEMLIERLEKLENGR